MNWKKEAKLLKKALEETDKETAKLLIRLTFYFVLLLIYTAWIFSR